MKENKEGLEILSNTPFLRENPHVKEMTIKAIKKMIYTPFTPYGVGRLLLVSLDMEELPMLPICSKNTEPVPHPLLKINQSIVLEPKHITSYNLDTWLRYSLMGRNLEEVGKEIEEDPNLISFYLSGGMIPFNTGYDIECYLLDT